MTAHGASCACTIACTHPCVDVSGSLSSSVLLCQLLSCRFSGCDCTHCLLDPPMVPKDNKQRNVKCICRHLHLHGLGHPHLCRRLCLLIPSLVSPAMKLVLAQQDRDETIVCAQAQQQSGDTYLPCCHDFVCCLYVFRFESSSAILGSMGQAADALVSSGMHTGQVACRVMYRLAHHADTLYASIQAQKHSPEWNTAQAVIKQKRQQVECCTSVIVTLSLCMAVCIPSQFICIGSI